MKTREDFKHLTLKHLDRWHMEELIDFLDEYELICDRNSQADLRMVHFMEKDVLAIFFFFYSPEPLRKGWLALISGKRTRLHGRTRQ